MDNPVRVFVLAIQERLARQRKPTTYVAIAEVIGISPQHLSKALQRGSVTTRTLRAWQRSVERKGYGMIAVTIAGDAVAVGSTPRKKEP